MEATEESNVNSDGQDGTGTDAGKPDLSDQEDKDSKILVTGDEGSQSETPDTQQHGNDANADANAVEVGSESVMEGGGNPNLPTLLESEITIGTGEEFVDDEIGGNMMTSNVTLDLSSTIYKIGLQDDLEETQRKEAADALLSVQNNLVMVHSTEGSDANKVENSGEKHSSISYENLKENELRRMSSAENYIDDLSLKSDYDSTDLLFPFVSFEQKAMEVLQQVKNRTLVYIDEEIKKIKDKFKVPQEDKELMVLPEYLMNPSKDFDGNLKSIDRVLYCVPKKVQKCVQMLRKDIETMAMTFDILINNFDVVIEACSLMNPALLQWRESLNGIRDALHAFEEKTYTDLIPWYGAQKIPYIDTVEMSKKKLDELQYRVPKPDYLNESQSSTPINVKKQAEVPRPLRISDNPRKTGANSNPRPSTSKEIDTSKIVKRPFVVPDKPSKKQKLDDARVTPQRKPRVSTTPKRKPTPEPEAEDENELDTLNDDFEDDLGSHYSEGDAEEEEGEEGDDDDQSDMDVNDENLEGSDDNSECGSTVSRRSSSKNRSSSKTKPSNSKSKPSKKSKDEDTDSIEIKICRDHPCPYVQPANSGSNFSRHNAAYHDKDGVPGNFIKTKVSNYEYAARLANWQSYMQVVNKERLKMDPAEWKKIKRKYIQRMSEKFAFDPNGSTAHAKAPNMRHSVLFHHTAAILTLYHLSIHHTTFKIDMSSSQPRVKASEVLKTKINEVFNPLILEKLNEVASAVEYNFVKPRNDCSTQTDTLELFCDPKKKKHKSLLDYTNFELFAVNTPSSLQGYVRELRNDVEFLNRAGLEVIEEFRKVIPGLSKVVPSIEKQNRLINSAEKQLKFLERSFYTERIAWLPCMDLSKITAKSSQSSEVIQSPQSSSVSENKQSSIRDSLSSGDKRKEKDPAADSDEDIDNHVVQICSVQYCNFVVEVASDYDFNFHFQRYHPDEKPLVKYLVDNVTSSEFSKLKELWKEQRATYNKQKK
uniref:Uncharacterized protein n=1 Tax=Tetranychus urticae TaxID=32264 RepID=T1L5D2_TETUR